MSQDIKQNDTNETSNNGTLSVDKQMSRNISARTMRNINSRRNISNVELKLNEDRADRCITMVSNKLSSLDLTQTDESTEIFEYGFGAPFSYWPKFTHYEYAKARYNSLKYELLNNIICKVSMEEWQEIMIRAETKHQVICNILGKGSDRNTPFAHYSEHYNELFNIKHKEKISLQHILSILFYTDLTNLPREMKNVCRKINPKETIQDVKKRHSELVHWLRLLFETIVLYGNTFGTINNDTVYHGLNRKFYFRQFKAKFYIPTSATTERCIAQNFTEGHGVILELGALETFGDPYFDTASLSAFPDEKEYLFFFAELAIKNINIGVDRLDMTPLSLYQSIVSGNIMIDKILSDKKQYKVAQQKLYKYLESMGEEEEEKEPVDEVEQYRFNLLKRFMDHNKEIKINKEEVIKKITLKKLREKFIEINDDKTFKSYSKMLLKFAAEIKDSEFFEWENTRIDAENILNEEGDGYFCSRAFKCMDRSKFYCQINRLNEDYGRMSLILHKIKGGGTEKTISFDLYCKAMKFYIRFHDIKFKLGGNEEDSRQGTDFKLEWLKKAYDKGKDIAWKITICH